MIDERFLPHGGVNPLKMGLARQTWTNSNNVMKIMTSWSERGATRVLVQLQQVLDRRCDLPLVGRVQP
jgi:hypothetical protein